MDTDMRTDRRTDMNHIPRLHTVYVPQRLWWYRPNSITLSWSQTSSRLVADLS